MEFLQSHLLSLILFSPAVGALLILVLPKEKTAWIRWAAFLISLIPFGLSLWLWAAYDPSQPGYQFVEQAAWYPTVRSSYHVGVDGISVSMVLLTTLLTPLSLLISWSIAENVRSYMVLFLLLETGMLGVFLALDLLLFFVFWEVGLVPMYFLINQWGSANRAYASFKFLIYTMAGSLGLLLASAPAAAQFFGTDELPDPEKAFRISARALDGRMVDAPIVRQAMRVLSQAERIAGRRGGLS